MRNLLLLVLFCLVGCGPIYSTRYIFEPPSSYEGRMCINTCLSNKSICYNNAENNNQNCYSSIQWLKVSKNISNAIYLQKEHKHHYYEDLDYHYDSERRRCDNQKNHSISNCDFDYRACYQNCGGGVFEQTYCSAFCDKIK